MRAPAYRSAQIAGTTTFSIQERDGASLVPNFCPAMKTTFAASGSRRTASLLAPRLAQRAYGRLGGEARHRDDPAARSAGRPFGGARRHPRERRPHLAARAEHDEVS